ncbi:MAG: hypothetical protein K8U03_17980 [Planctomycetia bacterium]|nr:hypothetical protein [Planctomycetia bacterium]
MRKGDGHFNKRSKGCRDNERIDQKRVSCFKFVSSKANEGSRGRVERLRFILASFAMETFLMTIKFLRHFLSAFAFCVALVTLRTAWSAEIPTKVDETARWENISDEFFKRIGVQDKTPNHLRRCLGMAVAPTGQIFIVTGDGNGICTSKDQGATWTVGSKSDAGGSGITGRCETGFSFSMAYPYDGRLAFFCIDGTGGITLDGGAAWRPFGKLLRMLEYADMDWSERDPQTIFGLLHEPYYTVLSIDGGKSWRQIYKESENAQDNRHALGLYYGLADSETLLRSHIDQGGIAMSKDAGRTWTGVAKFHIVGRRPVHFGKKTYWLANEGVVVSENGTDWTLTGKGPEMPLFGPYFGEDDRQMLVVSERAFSISRDGGKTWREVAPTFSPPDGMRKKITANGSFNYFGWDAKHDYLYASGLGASIYRLKLAP